MPNDKKENEILLAEGELFIDFDQVEEVSRVFFKESKEILDDLDNYILNLEEFPGNLDRLNVLFRKVHTIKGSVGAVPGGQLLGSLAHEFEALLGRLKKDELAIGKECIDLFLKSSRILKVLAQSLADKRELYPEELSEAIELISAYGVFLIPPNSGLGSDARHSSSAVTNHNEGVWLSTSQMNEFLKLSGELLVLKNYFQMMNQTVNFRQQPELFERRQVDFFQNFSKISDQFHGQMQSVRKEKAADSFQGLHVLVRQASTELNKNVQFLIQGGDLLIDKSLGKDLYESMVHCVRNSIDHGIEDQFERAVEGKAPHGALSLEIYEENKMIHLLFKDDGKGLDKDRILQKAISSAITTAEATQGLSDEQIYNFIFSAGFSTKDKVTTMSGRGIGMDIVYNTVQKYRGKITIESSPGQGAGFRIEIPIPQHVMVESALLCVWSGFQLAVPLKSVAHISSCEELQITQVERLRLCQFRGLTIPLFNYQEILEFDTLATEIEVRKSSVVFIKAQDAVFALLVDRIEAQTDLVVKGFGDVVKEQKGFKGISILADEKITYIIDPEKFIALLRMDVVKKVVA